MPEESGTVQSTERHADGMHWKEQVDKIADEQVRKTVEEIIEQVINRNVRRAWLLLTANFLCVIYGVVQVNSWKKDMEFALRDLKDVPAKMQTIEKWQGAREAKGDQWQQDIVALKQHDEQQTAVLIRLLEGQASIQAQLKDLKERSR